MTTIGLRVLHVSAYFAPAFRYGGPPRSILGLCQALTRAGAAVEVFTTTANGDAPLPAATDVPPAKASACGISLSRGPGWHGARPDWLPQCTQPRSTPT